MDHFSGFTWGHTFPDKAADNLVEMLLDLFDQFGVCEWYLTDNGKELKNKLATGKNLPNTVQIQN